MAEIEDRCAHNKYSPAETNWPNVVLTGRGDERGIFLGPITLRQTMLTFLLSISNPSLKPQPNTEVLGKMKTLLLQLFLQQTAV